MTEADILLMLERKHPAPAWAFFSHVASGTGGFAARTADAVAMSLWPSRGLDLYGFEVKTQRRDWLVELRQPQKAEHIARHCDYWFLVTAPEVIQPGELPATWGHYVAKGQRLYLKKGAKALKPKAVNRVFMASLLRKANQKHSELNDDEKSAIRKQAYADGKQVAAERLGYDAKNHEKLEKAVEQFEAASGLHLNMYTDGKKMGEAVRFIMNGGTDDVLGDLQYLLDQANRIKTNITDSIKSIKERKA